jgi:hypothetical protein
MGIHGHGFLDRVRPRNRMGWGVSLALMITSLLCTSVVDRVKAATPGPTGINRTVPKVSPPHGAHLLLPAEGCRISAHGPIR